MNSAVQKPHIGGAFFFLTAVLVIYLLVSNRSGWGTGFSWHDEQRWAQLWLFAGALAVVAWLVPSQVSRWYWRGFGLILLCVGLAPYPGWALAEVAVFCGVAATAWAVARLRRYDPARFDQGASWIVLLMCLSYLWGFGLVYSLQLGYGEALEMRDLFSGYANRRFFSQTQALTLPLLVLPLMNREFPRAMRGVTLVTAMAWWSLAFVVGTRAVWMTLLGVAVWSWCRWGSVGRQWVRWQGIVAAGGGGLFWAVFVKLPESLGIPLLTDNGRLATVSSATDSSGRFDLWRDSFHLIGQHPWAGIGPMHFAEAPGFSAAHPHDLPLQLAVEWGLPLTVVGIALVVAGMRRLFPTPAMAVTDDPVRVCLSAALLTAVGVSLFDGLPVMPYSQVLLAGVIGWAWGVADSGSRGTAVSNTCPRLWWRCVWSGGALLLAFFLVWLAQQGAPRLAAHDEAYMAKYPGQPFKPRFWQQGIIGFSWDDRYPAPWFKKAPSHQAPTAKVGNPD
ncbi:O-antigen ligase family protein [Oryzomicrobium sp.]|uniref:O-antigen ligase family protein n=1 Tax=Oryzomicrobium sp. TaxID=1911578 RepID=UPI002FE12849